jgi:hypothetical protein
MFLWFLVTCTVTPAPRSIWGSDGAAAACRAFIKNLPYGRAGIRLANSPNEVDSNRIE